MRSMGRAFLVLGTALVVANGAHAQGAHEARRAYFEAVAGHFGLPPNEVTILADWEIAPDEIPAVLFVAGQAGVSPEALVALRRAGMSWGELVVRYRISASALHVPVRDQAPAGALQDAYDRYRSTPVGEWSGIRLRHEEVVALVNVRVIAETLGMSAEEVIGRTGSVGSYVELFAQLSR